MSTQIFGDYDIVMDILKKEINRTFRSEENVVINIKVVNGDSRIYD